MPRGTPQNLIPQNKRTKSEQREIARQGGIAAGKKRREQKTIREALRLLFDERQKGTDGVMRDGYEETAVMLRKAIKEGNVGAVDRVVEIFGEKAAEKLEVSATVTIEDLIKGTQGDEF